MATRFVSEHSKPFSPSHWDEGRMCRQAQCGWASRHQDQSHRTIGFRTSEALQHLQHAASGVYQAEPVKGNLIKSSGSRWSKRTRANRSRRRQRLRCTPQQFQKPSLAGPPAGDPPEQQKGLLQQEGLLQQKGPQQQELLLRQVRQARC